jgi:hypothetical protein
MLFRVLSAYYCELVLLLMHRLAAAAATVTVAAATGVLCKEWECSALQHLLGE